MNHGVRKIRIAVCGHRQPGDLQRLETGIQEACQLIRYAFPGADYQVYSCLAEGADRLLARHLTQALPAGLVAILPLPETDYLQDFEQPASVAEFQVIKQMASEVIVLQNAALRPQSYRVANDRLLGLADVLVAIWDGQPSQGPGGTGELVADCQAISQRTGPRKGNTCCPKGSETDSDQAKFTFSTFLAGDSLDCARLCVVDGAHARRSWIWSLCHPK
jgi:hypothetical protein